MGPLPRVFIVLAFVCLPIDCRAGLYGCSLGRLRAYFSRNAAQKEPSPHLDFVSQQIKANRLFPQMSSPIETQMLSYVLRNSGARTAEMLGEMTDADVAAIGQAMNRAHQATGIKHRYGTVNPFPPKVSRDRLLTMLQGVRRTAARNLDRTLHFLDPDYAPVVGDLGAVSDRTPDEVASRVEAFLADHPGAAARLRKMGDAMANALKDPGFRETAKIYRLGLQRAQEYAGPRKSAYDVSLALKQSLRRELERAFPDLTEDRIDVYLRSTLNML